MSKIVLKIQAEEKTKRVQALPDSFQALKQIVEASFFKQQIAPAFNVQYKDADQELINVSDDEDLQTAYDVAQTELSGKLNLTIKPLEGQALNLNETQSDLSSLIHTQRSVIAPANQVSNDNFIPPASPNNQPKVQNFMTTDEEMKEPNQSKKAGCCGSIQDVFMTNVNHQQKPDMNDSSSDSSSDSNEDENKGDKRRKRKHHGRKHSTKRGNKKYREKRPLKQHKVIKKLIQRELDRQGPQILAQVIRESRDDEMTDEGNQGPAATLTRHENVVCDGCGIKCIIGIRFKCAVCKDFDFCEICEERLTHAHPFIKIAKPELAPADIQVHLHEGQFKDVQADNDGCCTEEGNPLNFFAQFCQGRDWRQAAQNWMERQETRGGEQHEGEHGGWRGHGPWRGHRGGPHRGGPHRGCGGRGGREARHFGGLVRQFCENLNEDPQKREEVCKNIGNCINQFVMSAGEMQTAEGEEPGFRGCNPKRAICTGKPEEIQVSIGKTSFAQIKIKNETKWPWRPGCYMNSILNQSPVDVPRVFVDREVKGGDEFELSVPLTLTQNQGNQKEWEVKFAFYRNDGKQMGTPFSLKVVLEEQDDTVLQAQGTNLAEAGMGSYDECLSALMNCAGDEGAALQMLYDMKVRKQQ